MDEFKKFLDPKNDLAFKRIFGKDKNKNILIHFLNDVLYHVPHPAIAQPVSSVTFIPTILDPEIAAQRVSIVDVFCEDIKGRHFIIEMQIGNELGFEKRAQYYAARAYLEQRNKPAKRTKKKEEGLRSYKDLQEVIFLAILKAYTLPDDDEDECISHHHILNIKTQKRQLKDFSFSFITLKKFTKKKNELSTIVDKWLYFFKHASELTPSDLPLVTGKDKALIKAYEELDRVGWTEEELRAYHSIEMKREADKAILEGAMQEGMQIGLEKGEQIGLEKGEQIGLEKGEQIGLKKGEQKGQKKFILQCIQNGMTKKQLSKLLSLSEKAINSILNDKSL